MLLQGEIQPTTPQALDANTDWISSWFESERDLYTAEAVLLHEQMIYKNSGDSVFLQTQEGKWEPLIDSGAARTVAGLNWLMGWNGVSSQEALQLKPIRRVFKFGSQAKFASLGVHILIGMFPCARDDGDHVDLLAIEADVLNLPIPFLMSQATWYRLNDELDFPRNNLKLRGQIDVPIRRSSSGHLTFLWEITDIAPGEAKQQSTLQSALASSEDAQSEWINSEVLKKLHIQPVHLGFVSLNQIIDFMGEDLWNPNYGRIFKTAHASDPQEQDIDQWQIDTSVPFLDKPLLSMDSSRLRLMRRRTHQLSALAIIRALY